MKNVFDGKRTWGVLGVLFCLTVLLWPATSRSQITVTTLRAPVNTLSISDLDFLNATTPKWLFTITMSSPLSVEVILTINLDVYLAAGETYVNAAKFISKPFMLEGTRTVTNLELGRGRGIPQRDVDGYIFNPQAKAAFQEIALPSGSMPAGTYRFTVDVTAGNATGQGIFEFNLTNPSSPVLLAPAAGETVVEELPLFEWQYDGPRATISIYEMLPGQRSLEEVASGTPQITATVSTRSFRYPVTGARPLMPGRTYVWHVKGLVGTAGGTDLELRSALRSFSVSTQRRSSLDWLLQELEDALPPSYKPVFDQIRAQDLSPSGTFRFNGSPISLADLLNALNDIRSSPESVSSVIVE